MSGLDHMYHEEGVRVLGGSKGDVGVGGRERDWPTEEDLYKYCMARGRHTYIQHTYNSQTLGLLDRIRLEADPVKIKNILKLKCVLLCILKHQFYDKYFFYLNWPL